MLAGIFVWASVNETPQGGDPLGRLRCWLRQAPGPGRVLLCQNPSVKREAHTSLPGAGRHAAPVALRALLCGRRMWNPERLFGEASSPSRVCAEAGAALDAMKWVSVGLPLLCPQPRFRSIARHLVDRSTWQLGPSGCLRRPSPHLSPLRCVWWGGESPCVSMCVC